MKKYVIITLVVFFSQNYLFSQEMRAEKYYLSNGVSFGVGITKGLIEEKFFNSELRSVIDGETNFSLGYQVIGGFILNPNKQSNMKMSIETGISLMYNSGHILSRTSNTKLKLGQAGYGVPISLMALTNASKYKLKYGGGIIFQRNFYKEISGEQNFKSSSWSLFKDGRIGISASGTYFRKVKDKNAFWGVGLQVGQDLNSNYNPETKIPFTLRKTNISIAFYPFLWFLNN